jgi:hypothetical protein
METITISVRTMLRNTLIWLLLCSIYYIICIGSLLLSFLPLKLVTVVSKPTSVILTTAVFGYSVVALSTLLKSINDSIKIGFVRKVTTRELIETGKHIIKEKLDLAILIVVIVYTYMILLIIFGSLLVTKIGILPSLILIFAYVNFDDVLARKLRYISLIYLISSIFTRLYNIIKKKTISTTLPHVAIAQLILEGSI